MNKNKSNHVVYELEFDNYQYTYEGRTKRKVETRIKKQNCNVILTQDKRIKIHIRQINWAAIFVF